MPANPPIGGDTPGMILERLCQINLDDPNKVNWRAALTLEGIPQLELYATIVPTAFNLYARVIIRDSELVDADVSPGKFQLPLPPHSCWVDDIRWAIASWRSREFPIRARVVALMLTEAHPHVFSHTLEQLAAGAAL